MALDDYENESLIQPLTPISNVGSRQALSSSQSLEKKLDTISAYALQSLTTKAEQEGQKYAVQNVPTVEQVARAIEVDEDAEALFVKGGSVYGDAAKKVQADMFRENSISTFLSKASVITTGIEKDGIDIAQVPELVSVLQSEIDATYNLLSELDPAAALKYSAQANKIGNSVFNAANIKASAVQAKLAKAEVTLFEDNVLETFSQQLKENKGDVDKTLIMTSDLFNGLKKRYISTNQPDQILELQKKQNKVITQYMVNTFADENLIEEFMLGNLPEYEEIIKRRGLESERTNIIQSTLKLEQNFNDAVKSVREQKEIVNKKQIDNNELSFLSGEFKGTPSAFIIKQEELNKVYTVAQKRAFFKPSDAVASDLQIENSINLEIKLAQGVIGRNDLQKEFIEQNINKKQYGNLLDKYVVNSTKYKQGQDVIKARLRIVGDETDILFGSISQTLKKQYSEVSLEFQDRVDEFALEGKAINQKELAKTLTKEFVIEKLIEDKNDEFISVGDEFAGQKHRLDKKLLTMDTEEIIRLFDSNRAEYLNQIYGKTTIADLNVQERIQFHSMKRRVNAYKEIISKLEREQAN